MLAGVSTPSRLCSEPPTGHQVRSKLPFLWLPPEPPERRTWRQGEEDVHQVARCWFPMSVLPGHIPRLMGAEPLLCQVGASGAAPSLREGSCTWCHLSRLEHDGWEPHVLTGPEAAPGLSGGVGFQRLQS